MSTESTPERDTRHRWKMTIELDAETPEDLAAKLYDLAYDLRRPGPGRSVFASPSCAGHVTITEPER